jgi:hypothetical protein
MRLSEGDVVCGAAAATARAAARAVEEAQWCSAGALARRLGLDIAVCRSLLEALEAGDYLTKPYHGRLPEGHRGEWLPDEEFGDEPLLPADQVHTRSIAGLCQVSQRSAGSGPAWSRSVMDGAIAATPPVG